MKPGSLQSQADGECLELVVAASSGEGDMYRLRMARSFGDFHFKKVEGVDPVDQPVIAVPAVTVHRRSSR